MGKLPLNWYGRGEILSKDEWKNAVKKYNSAELMEISDRFAALNEGRLTAPRPTHGLTVDEIGLMMGGAHDMEVAHADA